MVILFCTLHLRLLVTGKRFATSFSKMDGSSLPLSQEKYSESDELWAEPSDL